MPVPAEASLWPDSVLICLLVRLSNILGIVTSVVRMGSPEHCLGSLPWGDRWKGRLPLGRASVVHDRGRTIPGILFSSTGAEWSCSVVLDPCVNRFWDTCGDREQGCHSGLLAFSPAAVSG